MKIFLPFRPQGIGGTSVFAERFKQGMESLGHEVFFEEPLRYDVLFMIVQAPFRYLFKAKRKNIPIIQRLDGAWYWSVVQWKFPFYNAKAAIIRHLFTNFTVYQSSYSKYSSERFLGKKSPDPSVLIYNGVDTNLFTPTGKTLDLRDNPQQVIFFTSSVFRREDQILPILKALKEYEALYHNNFKLLIAGTFTGKVAHFPEKYRELKQVVFLGKIANTDLPAYERAADVFVLTHLNPPCPNNVIEALACGLPICGVNDGAMNELVEDGKTGLLVPTAGNAFWEKRDIDTKQLAENLHTLSSNKKQYEGACREAAEKLFALEKMLEKYNSVLKNIQNV